MEDAPEPRRWRRHVGTLAAAVVGLVILRRAGVTLFIETPWFLAVMVASAVVGRVAFHLWPGDQRGWRLHVRVLAHVVPIGVLTHLTSWGPALVPVQLIAVASNVKHGGFRTLHPSVAWVVIVSAAMQVGVELSFIPSVLPSATSHGIAALGTGVVVLVGMEFGHADRTRQRAEVAHDVATAAVTQARSEQQWLKDEIAWHAEHDAVTTLLNRGSFQEALGDLLIAGTPVAVLHVAIDGLQSVSDAHGPLGANAALRDIAQRIRSGVAGAGVEAVARLGSDGFGVLLRGTGNPGPDRRAAERVAKATLSAIRTPVELPDAELYLTASIGIALAPPPAEAGAVLQQASVALHAARSRGVDRFEIYASGEHLAVADRLSLAAELRAAVVNHRFVIEYQPIVDLRTDRIVAVEALVRWDHPTLGVIGPDRFIPEAERTGQITQIGRYVLEEAAWQARVWQRDLGDAAPTVGVNVSARQLDEHLIAIVEEVLDDTLLDPARLTLELTETAGAPGSADDLKRRLEDLRSTGVRLAMDDFGTGYASLEYLQELPLDCVKIDRAFVAKAIESPDGSLARAMVDLARAGGRTTVIEGIESVAQRDLFASYGCDRAQGYLFSPPRSADAITDLIRERAETARA